MNRVYYHRFNCSGIANGFVMALVLALLGSPALVLAEDTSIVVPQFPVMVSPSKMPQARVSPTKALEVKTSPAQLKTSKTAAKTTRQHSKKSVATGTTTKQTSTTPKSDEITSSPSFTIHSPMHRRAQKALKNLPKQSLTAEAYHMKDTPEQKATAPVPEHTPSLKTQPIQRVKSTFSADQLMHFPEALTTEVDSMSKPNTLNSQSTKASTSTVKPSNKTMEVIKTVEIISAPVTDSVIVPTENASESTLTKPIKTTKTTTKAPVRVISPVVPTDVPTDEPAVKSSVKSAVVTTEKPAVSPTKTGKKTDFKATVMPVSTKQTTLSGKTLPVIPSQAPETEKTAATTQHPDAMSALTPNAVDVDANSSDAKPSVKSPALRAEVIKIAKPAIKGDVKAMDRIKDMAAMGVPLAQQFLYFYRLADYHFSDGSVCEDCLMVGKKKGSFVLLDSEGKQQKYPFKKLKKRIRKEEYAYHRHHLMDRKGNKYLSLREYLFTPKYMVYIDKEGKHIKVKQTDIRFLTNANTGKIIVDEITEKSKK